MSSQTLIHDPVLCAHTPCVSCVKIDALNQRIAELIHERDLRHADNVFRGMRTAELETRIVLGPEELRGWEALERYGAHDPDCSQILGADDCCACGYSDVLIEAHKAGELKRTAVSNQQLRERVAELEYKVAELKVAAGGCAWRADGKPLCELPRNTHGLGSGLHGYIAPSLATFGLTAPNEAERGGLTITPNGDGTATARWVDHPDAQPAAVDTDGPEAFSRALAQPNIQPEPESSINGFLKGRSKH